jgi:hypothetical protein
MNKNNKIKAEIAIVQLGTIEIEGLYAEEIDQFGVAVPQICSLFNIPQKNANRDIKTLLDNNSNILKWRTPFRRNYTNVLLLPDFEKLLMKVAFSGNEFAQEMMMDLIGLSLHQLFADAFDHHFEKEQRQTWLKVRQQGKVARRTLTDALAEYITQHPGMSDNEKKYLYANITNKIYQGIFARTAGKLRKDWDITKSKENPRDKMTQRELMYVEQAEDLVMRLVDNGMQPITAVYEALSRLIIPVIER